MDSRAAKVSDCLLVCSGFMGVFLVPFMLWTIGTALN